MKGSNPILRTSQDRLGFLGLPNCVPLIFSIPAGSFILTVVAMRVGPASGRHGACRQGRPCEYRRSPVRQWQSQCQDDLMFYFWVGLVGNYMAVSTQIKTISQIASFSQVGKNMKNMWNHHLGIYDQITDASENLRQLVLTILTPRIADFVKLRRYSPHMFWTHHPVRFIPHVQ